MSRSGSWPCLLLLRLGACVFAALATGCDTATPSSHQPSLTAPEPSEDRFHGPECERLLPVAELEAVIAGPVSAPRRILLTCYWSVGGRPMKLPPWTDDPDAWFTALLTSRALDQQFVEVRGYPFRAASGSGGFVGLVPGRAAAVLKSDLPELSPRGSWATCYPGCDRAGC